ncbi:MAG TPA: choice-of-anchor E domain-containing protein [Bryobacteraceae bacterium]|nr:choice-of-anchor E domain-containing protein [Bryobacteraceae bacterium]
MFSGVNNFQASFLFPYFDSTLGTLQSVTVAVSESASGRISLTNHNGSGNPSIGDRPFSLSSNVVLSVPATPLWTVTSGTATWQGSTLPNEKLVHGGSRTITSPRAVTGGASASRHTDLNAFLGSDFFTVGVGVTTSYTPPYPALPSGITSSYDLTTTGNVVMTYNYQTYPNLPAANPSETPEPTTQVLFGSALLLLSFVKRRFQRR